MFTLGETFNNKQTKKVSALFGTTHSFFDMFISVKCTNTLSRISLSQMSSLNIGTHIFTSTIPSLHKTSTLYNSRREVAGYLKIVILNKLIIIKFFYRFLYSLSVLSFKPKKTINKFIKNLPSVNRYFKHITEILFNSLMFKTKTDLQISITLSFIYTGFVQQYFFNIIMI